MMPLPQPRPAVQWLQASPSIVLPSSQTSPTVVSTTPLPQVSSDLQSLEQPSPSTWLPSSQISPTSLSRTPLPQVSFDLQLAEQMYFPLASFLSGSSQTSPTVVSTRPLPQVSSDLQSAEQPSPSLVLPSSHTSPGSGWALPHRFRSEMQMGAAAAQCVPAGHSTPVASHCETLFVAHAGIAAASA